MFDLMCDNFAKSIKKIIQREKEKDYNYLLKLVLDGIKESKKPVKLYFIF